MSSFPRAPSARGVRPQLGRFGAVLLLAAAIVGTMTVGFAGAITSGLIYACVNNSSGTIKVVSATSTCANNEIMLVWNGEGTQGPTGPTGPTGPAGTFSGTFTSPNGQCSISVTDAGIDLGGRSCPLRIDVASTDVRSATTTRVDSGSTTTIRGSGGTTIGSSAVTTIESGAVTNITGSIVNLAGGCLPVARVTDQVLVPDVVGSIITGSLRVMAC